MHFHSSIYPFTKHFQSNNTNVGGVLVAQMVKHLLTMQETRVRSLGREDPLEKRMKTHSSILVWRILWTEEPGGLQSMWSQASDMIEEPILLPSQHKC